jgi:(E)-4-hydroxy-3-methylbut-2-enyl-diphosphate synthase
LPILKLAAPVALSLASREPIYDYRRLAALLAKEGLRHPIHLAVDAALLGDVSLEGASALGSLLMDGIGDSIEVCNTPAAEATRLAFNTLQASRLRISKAEFIACPSCGRTLFDLQETTQRIKSKTQHLKGVKIAIMGCIVNGPGEMADADFGYVGGGPGRIHLYVGKDCVEKNIPSAIADEKLIELIKKHNRWVEPPAA